MAGNTVNLEFAGDADKLAKASKQASGALDDVTKAEKSTSEQSEKSSKSSDGLLDKFSKLGNAVSGAGDAIDSASGLLDDWNQIQNQSYEKTQKNERALNDVRQAQEDLNQAIRDSKQATIDAGQAQIDKKQADLDAATALKQYKDDVKEFGANSLQARQDQIDLTQAHQDGKQAVEDGAQALRDANQATIDAKGAQLDLNDAQREAHPPDSSKWIADLQMYTPILSGLIGITGLVTAAQWAWNAAQLASPTTWIVIAIVALIAVIVLIATKTTWFQTAWKASWGAIKSAAQAVGSWFKDTLWGVYIKGSWDLIKSKGDSVVSWLKGVPRALKSAFSSVGSFISTPFRSAFNLVSTAWNNTIGRLNWTVPSWVPGIGGNSIGAPSLPHFHEGGTVPGVPGSNVLAMLQAGETVSSVADGAANGGVIHVKVMLGAGVLVEGVAKEVGRRGGDVQLVLGGRNG